LYDWNGALVFRGAPRYPSGVFLEAEFDLGGRLSANLGFRGRHPKFGTEAIMAKHRQDSKDR